MADFIDENKRYLIAVSGGPDSMALLDMVYKTGAYLEVAHVNYHKRESADRDEKIVRNYCRERKIVFHLFDFKEDEYEGNFQAAARQARYAFFSRVCKKNKLDEVLVAHHKDDLIETYLMQKERKLGVSYFGLKERSVIAGVSVCRPLLKYDKKQLEKYCLLHEVVFGIDESNLSDDYRRNLIRHHKVEKMSAEQKDELLKQIDVLNLRQEERYQKALSHLNKKSYTIKQFVKIPYLKVWFHRHFSHRSDLYFQDMLKQLSQADSCLLTGDDVCIAKEYVRISVFVKPIDYEYKFKTLRELKDFECEHFRFSDQGEKIESIFIKNEDLPITIRTYRKGDSIAMGFGHKKINRFFIDRKFKMKDRLSWPLVFNRQGKLIFVPSLGCDINHYCEKPNIFMIKL